MHTHQKIEKTKGRASLRARTTHGRKFKILKFRNIRLATMIEILRKKKVKVSLFIE
jgi:hypothetical protein